MLTINDLTPEEAREVDAFLLTLEQKRKQKAIDNHPLLSKIKRFGEVCEDIHSEYDDKVEAATHQAETLWEEIVNLVLESDRGRS